jgi:hypothetical protein
MFHFEETDTAMGSASEGETQREGLITIVIRGGTGANPGASNLAVADPQNSEPEAPSTAPEAIALIWFPEETARNSLYVAALLDSGMVEARSKRIDLTRLDPRAAETILRFLQDRESEFDSLMGRSWEFEEINMIAEAFDYLQVKGSDGLKYILLSLREIRSECIRKRYVDKETWSVLSIPCGRKKRYWRFWVCFLFCRNILPVAESPVEQGAFTAMLQAFGGDGGGGAITLRRELVEYGLIAREGGGSAYWRPKYTARMISQWLVGIPRSIV